MMQKMKVLVLNLLVFWILIIIPFTLEEGQTKIDREEFVDSGYHLVQGKLDLREWDPSYIISLQGEWEFYWNQQLFPQDFQSPTLEGGKWALLPSSWDQYPIKEVQKLKGNGYATFRALVELPPLPEGELYGIWILNASSAYQVWVNGTSISNIGKVGKSREEEEARYLYSIAHFNLSEKKSPTEILIQISNYHHLRGGLKGPIKIGTYSEIITTSTNRQVLHFSLALLLLFSAVYQFLLYYYRREMSYFYLGSFCLCFSAYLSFLLEYLLFRLFPSIPWELNSKLLYYSYLFPLLFFMLFLGKLYPQEVSSKSLLLLKIFTFFLAFYILLQDAQSYQQTLSYYYGVMGGYLLYSFWCLKMA